MLDERDAGGPWLDKHDTGLEALAGLEAWLAERGAPAPERAPTKRRAARPRTLQARPA